MMSGSTHLAYRRLRAPQGDRTALIDPPFEEAGEVLQANLELAACRRYDVQGRCLSELATEARRELLAGAMAWTSQYRDVDLGDRSNASRPIFLAGHQPQLFHPGVWLKNFALGKLAKEQGAVGVNLLVDSDTVKATGLRVPCGTVRAPEVAWVPLDRPGSQVPYEERGIVDREVFSRFADSVAGPMASLVSDPLVRSYWPLAVARSRETSNLGACVAQSRHQWEGRWGLDTLEIPQNRVCSSRSHGWLVAHVLAQLPRFRAVYNEVVQTYRQVHRIRSRAHPVPDLSRDGDWLEAPFWIWTRAEPRRRRLFARYDGSRMRLTNRHGWEARLSLSPEGDGSRAVDQLGALGESGVKIRSRALVTTLWARLALGDLFIHGIGGAKYDQVTDGIVSRFFGLKPPRFFVLSATLHLPIARPRVAPSGTAAIRHRLRELTYHPECYMNGVVDLPGEGNNGLAEHRKNPAELIAQKRQWIRTAQTPENAQERCRAIRRINEALQPLVASVREQVSQEHEEAVRAWEAEEILAWRGYGFCLYPEETLREFLDELLHKTG